MTLAIVIQPVYRRLALPQYPGCSAALAVLAISLLIVAPLLTLGFQAAHEAVKALQGLRGEELLTKWQLLLDTHPSVAKALVWLQHQFNIKQQVQRFAESLGDALPAFIGGSLSIVMQLLITLFVLYFLLRDRPQIVQWLRAHSPLTGRETVFIFKKVEDCLQATVVGHMLTCLIQGILGGMMMGLLGLPFAVLWGAVMAIFALIPTLGAPAVWVPAAVMLILQGSSGKGLILIAWGVLVIGTIDNILYPMFVGRKMTLHTVPILFSYLGGVVLFGFSGLVLGPLIVMLTWAFLEIWRQRTADGQDATEAIAADVR
jgi:predicted PurR-regulated permease PerM